MFNFSDNTTNFYNFYFIINILISYKYQDFVVWLLLRNSVAIITKCLITQWHELSPTAILFSHRLNLRNTYWCTKFQKERPSDEGGEETLITVIASDVFCIISPTSYRYAFLSAKQRTSTLSKKLSWYKLEFKVVSRARDHLVALSHNCQRPYQVPNP